MPDAPSATVVWCAAKKLALLLRRNRLIRRVSHL